MSFIVLLMFTVLSISGTAAYFSIVGLASIFSGLFYSVIVMGSVLEIGKLVAVSFVYRYWKTISSLMKAYLISAILVLMLITSTGIFGMLVKGYQQDILPLEQMQTKIALIKEKKAKLETLKQENIFRRSQLNKQVDDLPSNYATKREIARAQIKPELDQIVINLQKYSDQQQKLAEQEYQLKSKIIQQKAHTGPIIFVAEAFNINVTDATKWMIALIMFAFDPLAVILTLGINIAIVQRKNGNRKTIEHLINDDKEYTNDSEPQPSIVNVDDLEFASNSESSSIDQIKKAIEELGSRELTHSELAQKNMLEEMLRRKEVTERVRGYNKKDVDAS